MKDLSVEEKAKRYDEALKVAKDIISGCASYIPDGTPVIEAIFSELVESEDDKIRKALIKYLSALDDDEIRYGVSFKDMRAWLEKQGEKGIVFRDTFGYEEGRQKGQEEGIMLVLDNPQKYSLEKQEQKPAEDDDREYACQSPENYTRRELMIYNLGIINGKKMFEDNIKEDQQKPAWSEEDEIRWNNLILMVEAAFVGKEEKKYAEWLKSLKSRMQPQPKQEWSYNDEIIIGTIIQEIEKIPSEKFIDNAKYRCLDWLRYRIKLLKPQSQW